MPMKTRKFLWFFLIASFLPARASQSDQPRWVLLLAGRSGNVEMVDPATLHTLGAVRVGAMTDWVTSLPGGHSLLVALSHPPESQSCCELYSLDLESADMYPLIFPALHGTLSPDGHQLFVQRGNVGIDTVDLPTLARGPVIEPLGKTYLLQPSPYRRWLFGLTYSPSRSLDVFDLQTNTIARSLSVPVGRHQQITGTWAARNYYLFAYGEGRGTLWSVTPDTSKLQSGKSLDLHELGGDCRLPVGEATEPLILEPPVPAGGRLLVYEGFGRKFDRRNCAKPPVGGYYVIDPVSGTVLAHLAPSLYFAQLLANGDGSVLFGIDVGPAIGNRPPRLIRLDARTGKILDSREMNGGMVAYLALAFLYDSVIPRGEVKATVAAPPTWMRACPVTKHILDEPAKDPNASDFGFGEWYVNDSRTIWFPRQDWRAGSGNKVILKRPAGVRLAVSGRRLDGPAPPLQVDGLVSDYPGSTFEVIGMSFPEEGCWEITAKAEGNELRLVTTVAPARKNAMAVGRATLLPVHQELSTSH